MNLFAIPPHVPFLDAMAADWLDRGRHDPLAVAGGLILLPTRRAARALAEAFLRVSGGRPLLLPRITALGALDEAPLALAGALDLPPAVEPARAAGGADAADPGAARGRRRRRAPPTAPGRWPAELAALMDEAERAGDRPGGARCRTPPTPLTPRTGRRRCSSCTSSPAPGPPGSPSSGLMNPAARQVALLTRRPAAWRARAARPSRCWSPAPPAAFPPWPRLLRVVAGLPHGAGGAAGAGHRDGRRGLGGAATNSHPQAGLRRLLSGARRDARRCAALAGATCHEGDGGAARPPSARRRARPRAAAGPGAGRLDAGRRGADAASAGCTG